MRTLARLNLVRLDNFEVQITTYSADSGCRYGTSASANTMNFTKKVCEQSMLLFSTGVAIVNVVPTCKGLAEQVPRKYYPVRTLKSCGNSGIYRLGSSSVSAVLYFAPACTFVRCRLLFSYLGLVNTVDWLHQKDILRIVRVTQFYHRFRPWSGYGKVLLSMSSKIRIKIKYSKYLSIQSKK